VKRTPLTRKTPLRSGPGLPSRSRLKPYSKKRRQRDAPYSRQRGAAFERADGRCEATVHADGCSGRAEQVHHREGRNVPDPHHLDNLVCLSERCHSRAHLWPLWAYEQGLSIRKNRGAA
jgi:hypothetical protein